MLVTLIWTSFYLFGMGTSVVGAVLGKPHELSDFFFVGWAAVRWSVHQVHTDFFHVLEKFIETYLLKLQD